MIRTIDICLNAAHPEIKLPEATAFVGSPSAVNVRGIPPALGSWKITQVRLSAVWPDGEVETVAATRTGAGVWTATLRGCDTSGRVSEGLLVIADGTDEAGAPVTGYVLAVSDIAVYTRDLTIDAGDRYWYLKLFEAEPETPHEGDAYFNNGVLMVYDGTRWVSMSGGGGGTVDPTLDPTSSNAVANSAVCGGLDAKLNTSGGTMTGEITMSRGNAVVFGDANGPAVYTRNGTTLEADTRGTTGAVALLSDIPAVPTASTSTPLVDGTASAGSSADYARGDHRHPTDTSRQAALSQTQLNNIAAVPNKLDSSVTDAYSITVASGHLTVTDSQSGVTYTFAGPVSNPDDVARGEDLPYATGMIMDESEGVHYPFDRVVNMYEATDGDTTLTLDMPQPMPVDQGGRARDFILDVDNSANTGALGIEFASLGEDYALAVTDGDDLAEITELAAGERARFYFTETAQRYTPSGAQEPIPVISIQRMTIEVVTTQGGA